VSSALAFSGVESDFLDFDLDLLLDLSFDLEEERCLEEDLSI